MPKRVIFREKALQQYIQQKEKTVLPLWITPPIFFFLWLLLGLLILVGLGAWFTEVPVTARGNGIILVDQQQNTASTALIFLPNLPTIPPEMHTPVRIPITSGEVMNAHISGVVGLFSPSAARQRFSLESDPCQLSERPAVVLIVELDDAPPVDTIDGSCVKDVLVQVGSRQFLSLLPEAGW